MPQEPTDQTADEQKEGSKSTESLKHAPAFNGPMVAISAHSNVLCHCILYILELTTQTS